MAIKKKAEEPPPGAALWYITFSDLMSQLMAFFVIILAAASGATRQVSITSSIAASFTTDANMVGGTQSLLPAMTPMYKENARIAGAEAAFSRDFDFRNLATSYHTISAYLKLQHNSNKVGLNLGKDKFTVSITDNLIFSPGSAYLNPECFPVLFELSQMLNKIPNPIRIEGHTADEEPLNTSIYPSNWELSLARSMAVANFFIKQGKVQPGRFRVQGVASYKPVSANITEAGRAQNRRVDVIILANGEPNG